jgi:hypothetical protein
MDSNRRAWSVGSLEEMGVSPLNEEAQLSITGGRFILVGPMFSPGFHDVIRGFWQGFADSF